MSICRRFPVPTYSVRHTFCTVYTKGERFTFKKSYKVPSSFRLLSLSFFRFKTLEKVVDVWLKETTIVEFPLNVGQHAYQRGKSTEPAFSDLIGRVSDALD